MRVPGGLPPPQVNRTFQELALLKDVQEVWGALGPQLFDFLNDSTNLAMMQVRRWRPAGRLAPSLPRHFLPAQDVGGEQGRASRAGPPGQV